MSFVSENLSSLIALSETVLNIVFIFSFFLFHCYNPIHFDEKPSKVKEPKKYGH